MAHMILTITPNPSLDVSCLVEELIPNEKSYVFKEKRHPGGNGVNAGVMAKKLGSRVIVSGFLGGSSGQEYSDLLKKIKLQQDFVLIKGHTRTNMTISQNKVLGQTRLSFLGPKIKKGEVDLLINKISKIPCSQIIIGGSLPPGFKSTSVVKLIKLGHQLKIPVIVDVPGVALSKIYKAKPFLIKPNLTEFQELIGKKVSLKADVIREAMKMTKYVSIVCVSSVEGGAILVTKEKVFFGRIPKITIRSTVGAGDSMVGAMTYVLNKFRGKGQLDLEMVLRYGLAASAATLSNKGLDIGSKRAVLRYLPQIQIEIIKTNVKNGP